MFTIGNYRGALTSRTLVKKKPAEQVRKPAKKQTKKIK